MAASQLVLAVATLSRGWLATGAAAAMVGGMALLTITASEAAFATEAIFLPLGTLMLGLSLLAIGRVASRLVRSARLRERQLVRLRSLLGVGAVHEAAGMPDDSMAVIERAVKPLQ